VPAYSQKMFLATLSTLLVLSVNQAALGQTSNATLYAGSSPDSSSSSGNFAADGSMFALSFAANLSPGCQAAAGGLLTSDFGSCSNIMGLLAVVGASGSVVAPLTTWISGICVSPLCSADTLKQATQTVTSGCSAEIQKGSAVVGALTAVVSNYPGARNLLCTQYSSNSTFCVMSIIENVQAATGRNFTTAELTSLLSGGMPSSGPASASPPSTAYCNDCGHAVVTQSANFLAGSGAGGSMNSSAMSASMAGGSMNASTAGPMISIASTCGASFADGKVPSSVRIAGKDSAKPNSAGAALRIPAALAVAAPVALGTLFIASLV